MRKVTTVTLNGKSYQLDEPGYEALSAYLESAEERLADNPDKAEIMADLEQAIAEKCSQFLGPHKNVVSSEEVERVIAEMGAVDGAQSTGPAAKSGPTQSPRLGTGEAPAGAPTDQAATAKRLYQIREGAIISGVCNGFAAYFNIDVTIVRLIFVALAILTWGAWILVYIVMMFVIPYAQTSEQHAAAHGWPFNAQELIDRAKQHYAQFKDGQHWRWQWREQRRLWSHGGPPPWDHSRPQDVSYAASVLGGVFIPLLAVFNAVLVIALVLGIVSLVTKHMILGWTLPADIPLWAGILILVVLYHVVASPLNAARLAGYYNGSFHRGWFALWGAVAWVGFVLLFAWLAWRYWPQVQQFLQQLSTASHTLTTYFSWLSPSATTTR